MYLFIFEDGSIWQQESFTKKDKTDWECGVFDVVKFENGKFLKFEGEEYFAESWVQVDAPSTQNDKP